VHLWIFDQGVVVVVFSAPNGLFEFLDKRSTA